MITVYQTDFPTAKTPVVAPDGTMTTQGMSFWRALWGRSGQNTGLPNQVAPGLNGGGATQANATPLMLDWNQISVTPVGSGVIIPALAVGQSILINNQGLNTLKVYPPIGSQIDALGINAAYPLATLKLQFYFCFTTTQINSLQLG